jgi:hypothetical protein
MPVNADNDIRSGAGIPANHQTLSGVISDNKLPSDNQQPRVELSALFAYLAIGNAITAPGWKYMCTLIGGFAQKL